MTWFVLSLFLVPVALALVSIAVIIWRRRRGPSFKQISEAIDRDIAAAEAAGVRVDRTDRIVPARKRIKF